MERMIKALRKYAVVHIIEPKILDEGDDSPNGIPVTMLTTDELFSIFYASPPGEEKKEDEPPVMNAEEAREFRGEPTPVFSNTRSDSEAIRTTAKLLDLPQRTAISA
jgi:hypothetical protein